MAVPNADGRIRELPFVDGHVHFWQLDNPDVEYAWLGPGEPHPSIGDIEGLKVTRFAEKEFVAQSRFQHVTKAIHVGVSTSADPVAETRYLQQMADESGWPHGIVARCALAGADAAWTLERHMMSPNMRGVRDHGSPGSFDDPAWRSGYERLADHDLVFCHEVGLSRAAEAVRLLTDHPEVTFCLDHTAMPAALDAEYFDAWRAAVLDIARYESSVVKLSAFGQWGRMWTLDSVRPWAQACIDAFGPDRVFFGSNFPVDGLFSSYSDLVQSFRDLVVDYSLDEQHQMLAGNAERIFRI